MWVDPTLEIPLYETPREAEAAFYDAFQRADIDAMKQVWASDDDVLCIHPMGPRLEGLKAVLSSWGDVFSGGVGLRFDISDASYTGGDKVSVHCVFENISYGERFDQHSLVIATNVYRLTDAGWRICLHHGSPGRTPVVTAPIPSSATMH